MTKLRAVLGGFRFGLLLQFAVGPVTLFVFQIATTQGTAAALSGAAAVTIVDALFILAAILGVGALLEKSPRAKSMLRVFGAVVLVLFGANMVLGVFGINLIPGLNLSQAASGAGVFWRAFFITISSPLTIVFWAGIFSAKIAEGNMSRRELYLYGLGALLSTVVCFSVLCVVGGLAQSFVPAVAIAALNVAVGCAFIFFGFRTALRRQ